eukprot:g2567.t1
MQEASVDPEILKQQIENQLAEEAPATVKPFFPCCGGPVSTMEKCSCMEELANKAPASIKPLFPFCGGPVGTMEKCICMVQADQQEDVKKAIEKYKTL